MIKKLSRIIFAIFLFLPMVVAAHFFAFPQETRCMLIDVSDFKTQQNIYFRPNVPQSVVQRLINLKAEAEKKVYTFWKDSMNINYKLIYCANDEDYKNYGTTSCAPAVSYMKLGAYVVIPADMFDVNILSHEISHTVLYRRIGWYKLHFKIPVWFDEGLAMQVDGRDYYSIDTLLCKKTQGIQLPDVTQMETAVEFHTGPPGQVMLNYATSKYKIHQWLKTNPPDTFIKLLNYGYSFDKCYGKK